MYAIRSYYAVTEAMPASAETVKLPGVAPAVSGSVVSVAFAAPSVSGTVMTGVPSVCPLMVMLSVAVLVLPSASVIV